MKTLLAVEVGLHPFWQRNKYHFFLVDNDSGAINKVDFSEQFSKVNPNWNCAEVEFFMRDDGVYAQLFSCGSGYGKSPYCEPFLVIARNEYDKLVIAENDEKREAERSYQGNWKDNSDFERE